MNLEAIVQIKLTAFREKDQGHLRDFIELAMVDTTWLGRFPSVLDARLRQLLDEER